MAYDEPNPGDALDRGRQPPPPPPPPDKGESENTIKLPRESLPGCEPGDTYKVVSADDREITLEHVAGDKPDEEAKWADDFREHMSAKNDEPMSDDLREEMS